MGQNYSVLIHRPVPIIGISFFSVFGPFNLFVFSCSFSSGHNGALWRRSAPPPPPPSRAPAPPPRLRVTLTRSSCAGQIQMRVSVWTNQRRPLRMRMERGPRTEGPSSSSTWRRRKRRCSFPWRDPTSRTRISSVCADPFGSGSASLFSCVHALSGAPSSAGDGGRARGHRSLKGEEEPSRTEPDRMFGWRGGSGRVLTPQNPPGYNTSGSRRIGPRLSGKTGSVCVKPLFVRSGPVRSGVRTQRFWFVVHLTWGPRCMLVLHR